MSTDPDLQARFDALREADHSATPAFGALADSLVVRKRHPVAAPAMLVAAAVVLALGGLRLATRRTRAAQPGVQSILSWRSPTDALLHAPEQTLWRTVPTLESTLLSGVPIIRHPGDQ
jgi:hypothetical protein